jgi:Tfp pilus assembly protein PilF
MMDAGVKMAVGEANASVRLERAREAVRLSPSDPALLNNLGLAFHDCGDYDEAIRVYESTLALVPASGAVYYNLGNTVRAKGDPAGAVTLYQKALSHGTDVPEVYNNLGLAWQECGCPDRAHEAFRTALKRNPHYVPAGLNYGYALIQGARPEEAEAALRSVLRNQPDCVDAHWLLSHALLLQGKYEEGWPEYEWRWQKMSAASYRRTDPARRWTGGEIPGARRILLYAEQGLGDAIQFIRFAPLVEARGGKVAVECHRELVSLFRHVEGVSEVYARGEEIPETDVECPLLSLPGVLGTTRDTIPAAVPYVWPDRSRVERWRDRCVDGSGRARVGLVWAGNPGHRNDANRSLPPEHLGAFAGCEGVQLFSLQKGEGGDMRLVKPSGLALEELGPALQDVEDTAAVMVHMNLIITVDTAVAHLAGAMGKPVWLLVPYSPDWRWMLGRDESPWYPTMKLFRQGEPGSWGAVIARVLAELKIWRDSP